MKSFLPPPLIIAKVFILFVTSCSSFSAAGSIDEQDTYPSNDQEPLRMGDSFRGSEDVMRHKSPSTSSWLHYYSPAPSYPIPWGPVAEADKFEASYDQKHLGTKKRRRRHRLLSADTDDNDSAAMLSSAAGLKGKSNPLIERTLESEDEDHQFVVGADDIVLNPTNREASRAPFNNIDPALSSQHHHESRSLYGNGENMRPLLGLSSENHDGSKSRSRNRNDWCHRDCTGNNNNIDSLPLPSNHRHQVCGSDGRFYSSMCELRRHACRYDIYLYRRTKKHCLASIHKPQNEAETQTYTMLSHNINDTISNDEEVRIVDLKRLCLRAEYDEMKLSLLREFDGDIESMFRYFDSNDDGAIEAHELWPKRESNKLLYAQAWDDHSTNCASGVLKNRRPGPGSSDKSFMRTDSSGDNKCWFFLDFAFEPHIATNPCSLSHLMLFDLKHPNNKFDLEAFELAFKDMKERMASNPKVNVQDWAPKTKSTCMTVNLGDSLDLACSLNMSDYQMTHLDEENIVDSFSTEEDNVRCYWSRYNTDLMTIQDAHISIRKDIVYSKNSPNLRLHIEDAQLYLSGQFKCACHSKKYERTFDHLFSIQVIANPRIDVKPKSQWSLPNSRISFECHYDYIDTSGRSNICKDQTDYPHRESESSISERGQNGLKIKWLKDNQEFIVDSKSFNDTRERTHEHSVAKLSQRASITMTSSRLTVEQLNTSDTGHYTCQIDVPTNHCVPRDSNEQLTSHNDVTTFGQNNGSLLVQDRPLNNAASTDSDPLKLTLLDLIEGEVANTVAHHLWMFHDNGISIYRFTSDDGQEMELLREINGHSLVSGEVDGNWNQLTLCGGLNPEQVVICEWSDNALHIDVSGKGGQSGSSEFGKSKVGRSYVYVGQPNLNRVIVMDGSRFEIVAIINTEPQPRKLFLYKPSKIHLSKWVRRRLSPAANARWLSAIGKHAHSLKSTPKSNLYSERPSNLQPTQRIVARHGDKSVYGDRRRRGLNSSQSTLAHSHLHTAPLATNQPPSSLIQHDIWLLCYGQPLVLDPTGEEHLEDVGRFHSTFGESLSMSMQSSGSNSSNSAINDANRSSMSRQPMVKPFAPRLSAGPQFAWSVWLNKEAKLRNRKSVHIIQSTFFPKSITTQSHYHEQDGELAMQSSGDRRSDNLTAVGEFKKSTVLTTHHIFSGVPSVSQVQQMYLNRAGAQFDLIQDLYVPPKPYSMEINDLYKIHNAYVTHYDDRRLFRVSMDEYRYNSEIDLQNCDPIKMITTAQGLLVIQCRAPITHNLIGQMVLDQLTSSRIEFNANIRAQESYLSPDHRYLVSIYTNSTPSTTRREPSIATSANDTNSANDGKRRAINEEERRQSIVYVQLVSVDGLKLQYEIKTQLEINQCSFVWKDGYYAAIFVSTNRRDGQSEILSLRLADSRLELMARVPGLISATRHKEQLIVSPELRLAALSTNQGTYVVDLEENRVLQSLRHHHGPPTLLWA